MERNSNKSGPRHRLKLSSRSLASALPKFFHHFNKYATAA